MNQNLQCHQYLQDAQKFQCSEHPDCQMKAIDLALQSNFKSRILCLQCILNNSHKITQNSVFQIRDLLINPIQVINQIMEKDSNQIQQQQIHPNMIEKLINELEKLKELINEQIKVLKLQFDEYYHSPNQSDNQLLEKLSFAKFQELFNQVWQMDIHQGTTEYKKLLEYFDWLALHIRLIVKTSISDNFSSKFHRINTFGTEFYDQSQLIGKCLRNMDALNIPQEIIDFPEIHSEISQGQLIKYELIYQGTVHGLNSTSYWEKVNNKSQLLTFMTSENGNQFGGYSPLKLSINANYLHDESLRSFIFQYTKKELYKQKVKEDTIYCSKECGPVFGARSGNDLLILEDFKMGYSKGLGEHFDISKYQIENKLTHIFGDESPKLIECKVYKITFL